ncbi:MFS transporter [Bradyrhizobium mercantei]|uniref:MFS transporter n=1 Tax=Bradyrhizobium mercantei TaxID=1904807 RepID=UPI0009758017|nr:MFS transporter [Bradyrhizobium mercantei]
MNARATDVGVLIDESRFSPLQIRVVALCGLASILDGVDTQSIGIAAPELAKVLSLTPAGLAPIFAAGLLGALTGALGLGTLADRVGRKQMLILSTVLFGLFSLLTVFVTSFEALLALRFCAGLGLGGAAPCFTALAAEYTPARKRPLVIALMWASFPLGGMTGAFVGSALLKAYGWTSIFYVGGILPMILAVILALAVPESLRFLALRGKTQPKVRAIAAQIKGSAVDPQEQFTAIDHTHGHSGVRSLFTDGRLTTTLLLWVIFCIAFTILVFIPLWVPTLLVKPNGLQPSQAFAVVALNNGGAVVGMLLCGALLARIGPFKLLTSAFVLATVFTAAVGQMPDYPGLTIASAFLSGLFLGCGGVGVIALATAFYPTLIRSTGLGWGLAMARGGQVCGPLVTGWMLRNGLGASEVFLVLGLMPIIAAIAVLLLTREKNQIAVTPVLNTAGH